MQGTNQPRPSQPAATNEPREKLLRIGVIQDKAVVEERFVRGGGDVTIGSAASNVLRLPNASHVPSALKLFEARGNGRYTLVFERGMDGRVDVGGQPETFQELAQSGKAKKRGNQYVLDLPENARGKAVFGNVVLLFQFVDAPTSESTAMKSSLGMGLLYKFDWPYRYIIAAVFLVMGGSGLSMQIWWMITGQYYHKPFGDEEAEFGQLRVEMAPEKKKKKEAVAKVETPVKISETPVEAKVTAPVEKKPSGGGGNPSKNRGGPVTRESRRDKMAGDLRKSTFLNALSANGGGGPVIHNENIASAFEGFGDNAGAAQAGGAGAGMGGPEAAGGGGDGGRYKSLSQADVGGSRIATTTAKTEEKTADSEVKIKANVRDGAVSGQEGTGEIDKDSVAKVFSRRKGAIKYCYENALRIDSGLHGKVTIRFTIGPAGRITSINAVSNTTNNAQVADCIIDKVQGWRFDPPKNGSVTFSYPFLLDTK